MYILVHNEKYIDSDEDFKRVHDEILKPFGDLINIPYKHVIDIGPRFVRIDFRSGDVTKLSGIQADYYISYSYSDRKYFEIRSDSFGKELNSLDDIFDVVIEYIKNCVQINKESED